MEEKARVTLTMREACARTFSENGHDLSERAGLPAPIRGVDVREIQKDTIRCDAQRILQQSANVLGKLLVRGEG